MLGFAVGFLLLLNGVANGRRLLECEQTSTEAESQKCENEDLFGPVSAWELSGSGVIAVAFWDVPELWWAQFDLQGQN
ncbi:hypothetical protein BSKO_05847 [Bryopsis sp. KO-2023]|nr:hypothetical protein BSKO_05847 [Bryopsis sp. KO-2023]